MATKNPSQALNLPQTKPLTRSVAETGLLVPMLSILMTVGDLLISFGAFVYSYHLTTGKSAFVHLANQWLGGFADGMGPYFILLLFAPLVRLACLHHFDLYRLRGEFSFSHDLLGAFLATSIGSLVVVMMAFFYRGGVDYPNYNYPRWLFAWDWLLAMVGVILLRVVIRSLQTLYRQKLGNLVPALVVGHGQLARLCLEEITSNPRLGYRVVGLAINDGDSVADIKGVPVLGSFSHLPAIIKEHGIEEVLITDSRINPKLIFETIMRCGRGRDVDFRVVPDLFTCLPKKTEIQQLGALPLIKLFEEPLEGFNRFFKRAVDLISSIAIIVGSVPIWLPIMIAIKLDSRGPLFYIQERVGMDGRPFGMYKFRSMYTNNDDSKHRAAMAAAIKQQQEANQGDGEKPVFGKVKNDPRITKVGRFIRKYSIDELPQLINVVQGDMSLVGPRPPIPYEVDMYDDWHRARFHATPGITGLWQVSGRNSLTFDEMIQLDVYYIKNWSIWLDVKILLKTPLVVLKGEDAY